MKFKFPSAQTILIIIAGLVSILTWLVPAGDYETLSYDAATSTFLKDTSSGTETLPATQASLEQLDIKIPVEKFTDGGIYKPIAIPGTYQEIDSNPQGFFEFIQSPIKGVIQAADIIFLVLIIGGLIGIMNLTGAFDAGIVWLAKALKDREYMLIIAVTALIALGGTTFGLAEETMAFYPILIPVFLSARYDAMTGLACIFLGSAIGTMYSTVNPFSTIIASDAAGINWTTGINFRIMMLIGAVIITILYIYVYAERVKKRPEKSLVKEESAEIAHHFGLDHINQEIKLTGKLKLILVVFSLSFVVMVYGVSRLGWWLVEMSATFLVAAILIGFIARVKESDFVEHFAKGASELLNVAFIIGIARGVSVLMDDGQISDTMLYYASNLTDGMGKGVFINVMMVIFSGLSFFIPSSSGMAVLTMPIMAPLADQFDMGREHIINAYMYGSGLFFFINPTGLILASLAIVKFGFDKWLKFIMPLFFILLAFTAVALTVSVYL